MLLQTNAYDDDDTNVVGSKVERLKNGFIVGEEAIAMAAIQHQAKSLAMLKD